MSNKLGLTLLKISRFLWCAAAILVPLVMFPWTTDVFDFNKSFVLVILGTGIAATSFLGMAITKTLRIKTHPILLLPVFFLIVAAISSAFSLAPATSFMGEGGQEHVSLLLSVLLYFLMLLCTVFFEDEKLQKSMSMSLLVGSAIAGVLAVLTFFGLSIAPFQNTVGVPTAFAVYMIVMTMFGSSLYVSGAKGGSARQQLITAVAFAVTAFATALSLIAFDSVMLWVLVIITTLFLFTFVFARPELMQKTAALSVPGMFLALSIVFIFISSPIHGKFPPEVSLNLKSSMGVVSKTLAAHPILGSGPGTFGIDYTQYSPVDLNNSLFWDTRFSTSMSEFFTMLATYGILGILAGLLFPLFLGIFVFRAAVSAGGTLDKLLPPLLGWVTLCVAFFLFSSTVTTVFFMMLFMAWIAAIALPASKEVSHAHSPRLALLSSFGALLGTVAVMIALFLSVARYAGELAFAKAVARDREGAPAADVIRLLNSAATLNQHNDTYYRNLANALLIQTSTTAADPKVDPAILQGYLAGSVNAALAATAISPNNVTNWQMLGTVYREFSSVVKDANNHAIGASEKAASLAPNNPKYLVDVARTYIVRSDLLNPLAQDKDEDTAKKAKDAQAESLTKAADALKKAIELKSDYASARYYSSFVSGRQGDLAGAVQSMEVTRAINPKDVGVSIQLSLLYLRQGKNDLAATELERALALDPKNDNVKWYLSVAYEAKGSKDKAINLLQDLVKTNPDNETVKTRLDKLMKNETTVKPVIPEPIEPTTPPADTTIPAPATP